MKALTLTQPWASLVEIGEKFYETRDWGTPHRGLLAIHAGKNLAPVGGKRGLEALVETEPFHEALFGRGPYAIADNLPFGEMVAIVRVADVIPTRIVETNPHFKIAAADCELDFGNYGPGRFAWEFADVLQIREQVPVRGHQKIWNWQEPLCTKCSGAGTLYMGYERGGKSTFSKVYLPCEKCHGTGVGLRMEPVEQLRERLNEMVERAEERSVG